MHSVLDPSSPHRPAAAPDVERHEASEPHPAPDAVLRRLVDLVADRASELTAFSSPKDVDLGRLSEAMAALEGYCAAIEFAETARRTDGRPPTPAATSPDAEIRGSLPPAAVASGAVASDPGSSDAGTTDAETTDAETTDAGTAASGTDDEIPETATTEAKSGAAVEAPSTSGSERRKVASVEVAPEPNGAAAGRDHERDYPPFRDQVTGLHSREGFDAVASGELKRCRRHGRVFSLVLLQLPGADGDGLRRAANAVSAAIRESDLAGRQIDRTLAVALPEAPPNEARIVAERIIGHCEGVGVWGSGSRVALVTHPTHGETLVHLIDAARAQLTLPARRVLSALDRGSLPDQT